MDELGHFDLGSQVILSLPEVDVCFEGSPRLFPGDPIASKRCSPSGKEPSREEGDRQKKSFREGG